MRLLATVPLGAVAAAATGVLVYLLIYLPMQRRGAKTISVFVASLGANLGISALLQIAYGPELEHFSYQSLFASHRVLGLDASWLTLVCVLTGILVVTSALLVMFHTRWGKQVRAVGSNGRMAALSGIRTVWITATVFAISSVVAVIAAMLLGLETSVAPPVDPTLTLFAAIAVLLAGRGSYGGAYAAGLLLGVIEAFAGQYVPGNWAQAVVFAVFVIVVLLRPQGLLARRIA